MDLHNFRILILDFGSQYTQLIARRVRELGVYCELMNHNVSDKAIVEFRPNGIILSGGPETVTKLDTPRVPGSVFDMGCPVLGICYGMQAMALQLGGEAASSQKREFGHTQLKILNSKYLLQGIEDNIAPDGSAYIDVWMSHGDIVARLPDGFESIAETKHAPFAAMANFERQYYGLQFHPEVTHTPQGQRILKHFVIDICGCEPTWTTQNIIDENIAELKQKIGHDKVLVALSGGVDSAVVAAIIHRAVGDQLTCLFVDTGLLRKDEGDEVMRVFSQHMGVKVIRINAQDRFLKILEGITDPEQKRKLVGHEFIHVFEEEAERFQGIKWLGQGTIYPDVIESAKAQSSTTHVIKTHHNVGGLPEELSFQLIEPLRELFKDEVRKMGIQLGLPSHLIHRHPFPGPGLSLRVIGEVKKEYLNILREADAIFLEELRHHGLYDQVSQAFAVFLPIKSVGVQGDQRCYEYVIALRSVETTDFMTAKWSEFSYAFLAHVSHRIVNEISKVSRVVYDITGKPPATIEWE